MSESASGRPALAGYGARRTSTSTHAPTRTRDGLAWIDLVRLAWTRRWIVGGTTLVVLVATLAYLGLGTPTYRASATLLVESEAPAGGVLGQLASLSAPPIAAGEMELLRSRTVAESTVAPPADGSLARWDGTHRALGLATLVEDRSLRPLVLKWQNLRGTRPPAADVRAWLAPDAPHEELWLRFEADAVRAHAAPLFAGLGGGEDLGRFPLQHGRSFELPALGLTLRVDGDPRGRDFRVHRVDGETAVKRLRKATRVSEVERNTGVLRVSVDDSDPHRAAATVNALCANYLDANVARGKRRASRTLAFLDEQLEAQLDLLHAAEGEVVALREAHPDLVDVAETTRLWIETATSLAVERTRLELGSAALADAAAGIAEGSVAGLGRLDDPTLFDPVLVRLVEAHEALARKLAGLDETVTEVHPERIEVAAALERSASGLQQALGSKRTALELRAAELAAEQAALEAKLGALPATERDVADPLRRYETHKEVYTFLLTSQQEAKLTHASTIASSDLIDPAVRPSERHAPRLSGIGLVALVLGLAAGLGLARVVDLRLGPVENAAAFEEATGLAVLASVPDFRAGPTRVRGAGDEFLVVRDEPDHPAAEAFRALRANLRRLPSGDRLVHVAATSAAPGEGKSTTNLDLALAFAAAGKRVLLVDADLRKPSAHRYLGLERGPGLAEALEGSVAWRDVLQRSVHGLEVLTAGRTERALGDLFGSEAMERLVDEFGAYAELVVYDLPPALAVADAADFAHRLDAMLLVYRTGGLPRTALVEAKRRLEHVDAPLVGGVLTAVRTSRGTMKRYGYGYYGEDE